MARHARLAEVTLEQAEETEDAVRLALATLERAMADEHVTVDEARRVFALLTAARNEAADVVRLAERTSIAELVAAAVLTDVGINPRLSRRIEQAGMTNIVHFPGATDGPRAA